MELCSGSALICMLLGGLIWSKPICSWMLMKGQHSLWGAGFRILTMLCTFPSCWCSGLHQWPWPPGEVSWSLLCHAAQRSACLDDKQMKYPLRTAFLCTTRASWRASHRLLSARTGPTYKAHVQVNFQTLLG